MKRISLRLPDSLTAMLETQADGENLTLSTLIRKILCKEMGICLHEDLDETANPELPLS